MLWETVRLALLSVRRNVLRSFLTLLGIVIGVAAVIAMITIGSGTTEKVRTDISKLGSNLLVVRAARPDRSGSTSFTPKQLDDKDVAALAAGLTNAKAVAAAAQKQVRVVYGAENIAAEVTGTDTDYFIARDWNVLARPRLHGIGSARRHRRLRDRRDGAQPVLRRGRPDRPVDPRQPLELQGHRRARAEGHVRLRPGPGQCRDDAAGRLPAPHRRRPRHRHDLCRRGRRRADLDSAGRASRRSCARRGASRPAPTTISTSAT